jgi:hypothetical protein
MASSGMLRRVAHVRTDVSEELLTRATRRNIPEDFILQNYKISNCRFKLLNNWEQGISLQRYLFGFCFTSYVLIFVIQTRANSNKSCTHVHRGAELQQQEQEYAGVLCCKCLFSK